MGKVVEAARRGRARVAAGMRGTVETYRLASGGLVMVGAIATVLIEKAAGGVLWLLVGVSLLVSAGLWVIGEARAQSIKGARVEARGETLLDLGHLLEPLVHELGRVSTLPIPERRKERSALRQAVVNAASGLSPKRLRANYFELQPGGQEMTCVASTGRAGRPTAGFVAGVRSGDDALRMVQNGGHVYCESIAGAPPANWEQPSHAEYQTFISVTVGTPGKPAGMLSVDAPEEGDLTDEDLKMLFVLGHLLGIAEELTS